MAKSVAPEGAKHGIKSNAIAPVALSRITEGFMSGAMAKAFLPEAIAPVVAYRRTTSASPEREVLTAHGGQVGRTFVGECGFRRNGALSPKV
jgi:NAD(P)-dependent dehydrogenase (short-subunit alcohol dehydrogenase family)